MFRNKRAFTLVELLVVIAIIAVLMAIVLPALRAAKEHAAMVQELAASRQLVQAYVGYALDNDERLLVGHQKGGSATNERGEALANPEAASRYPWRLVAYIDHGMQGSIFVNGQYQATKDLSAIGDYHETYQRYMWEYYVSLYPSFGMNLGYVGGSRDRNGNRTHSEEMEGCLKRLSNAVQSSRLIVFGSARSASEQPGTYMQGYFKLMAPRMPSTSWASSYKNVQAAQQWGYVSPRWNDNAVFSHLDGHSELLDTDAMRDMTRWSNKAAMKNDPDWDPES